MSKVRTARGDIVDFDFLKIKQKLAEAPVTVDVKARKQYVDDKESVRKKKTVEQEEKAAVEVKAEAVPVVEAAPEGTDSFIVNVNEEIDTSATRRSSSKNKASG